MDHVILSAAYVAASAWLLVTTAAAASVRGAKPPDHFSAGLAYYASFEEGLQPVVAGGSTSLEENGATLTEGRVGRGASITRDSMVIYARGNYDNRRGTVAFWMKPEWDPDDQEEAGARVFFRGGWVQLCYDIKRRRCFFMTGDSHPPEGFRWTYSSWTDAMRAWEPGTWHHLAFTWDADSGRKIVYLDGTGVSDTRTEVISKQSSPNLRVTLGSRLGRGVYDEWMIWDRALSAEDVSRLALAPAEVARTLAAAGGSEKPPPKPAWPLKLGIKQIDPPEDAIVPPGGRFAATVPAANPGARTYDGTIGFALLDFRDRVRARQIVPIRLEPGAESDVTVTFDVPPERGVFKIAARIERDGETWERDVSSFAAWPEPVGPPDADSFFGNHVNSWYGARWVRQSVRLGQSWQRNHDMLQATWWNRAQPEPGEFQWTMDENLGYFASRGVPVLGGLTGTPYWAVAGGPMPKTRSARGYSNPPVLDHWRHYVTETVKHFRDRIHHWEIYNEPSVSAFWNGSPEEHAELVRAACAAIREVDPSATVMASGYTSVAWRWQEAAAEAGAFRDLDVLSIHYGTPMLPPEENQRKLADVLEHFRGLLRRFGPEREPPIWSTEGGTGDTTWFRGLDFPELPPEELREPMNARRGAARVVQGSALLQLAGVRKHFYYLQNPQGHGARSYLNTSMIDVNWAPRPKLIARVAMAQQLQGTRCGGDVRRPEAGRFWAVLYENTTGPGTVVLWWAGDGGQLKARVEWPGPVGNVVDIMGNARAAGPVLRVTDEPGYVRVAAPLPRVRAALQQAEITIVHPPQPLAEQPTGEDGPDVPPLPDFVGPGENPAGVFFADLRPLCNMGFADEQAGDGKGGWADEGRFNDMRDFPVGKRTFCGVPFDVIDPATNAGRSIVALKGANVTPSMPERVVVALEPRPVRYLYFLHAAAWGHNGTIGRYVIRYDDGTTADIPNVIPRTNGNWWTGHSADEESHPVPVRVSTTAAGKPAWRYVRVYQWENPKPGANVTGLEIISAGGGQTPIVIAITGV